MKYALSIVFLLSLSLSLLAQSAHELTESGNAKMKEGNSLGAIKDYTSAIQTDPQFAEAFYGRGSVLAELDQFEEALRDLNQALVLNPTLTEIYYNRAYIFAALGNYDRALTEYNSYLEQHPDEAQAWLARAEIKEMKGGLEAARSDYANFLKLDWDVEERHLIRSEVLLKLGDTTRSIEELNKHIAKAPSDHKLYRMRGGIYFALGENNKAIADLSTALLLHEDAHSYLMRSDVYADDEEWTAAMEDLKRGLEAKNAENSSDQLYLLGFYALQAGRLSEAVASFESALAEGFKDIDELHYNLGLAQLKSQNAADACANWQKCPDLARELIDKYCDRSASN